MCQPMSKYLSAPVVQSKKCFLMITIYVWLLKHNQSAFTCSKLTVEALEQGVKHVQSY